MKKVEQARNARISTQQVIDAQDVDVQDEDLHSTIATAAYFRAQKRGFEHGQEIDDWLAAEAEVKGKREESWEA